MAHWYVTCHGNAVNLDHARQIFVKPGRDGLYRVCAEFVVSLESGSTVDYSLESGMLTEEEADLVVAEIASGLKTAAAGAPVPFAIHQVDIEGRSASRR